MLSNGDLERLIAQKKCEIKKEKIVLGLVPPSDTCHLQDIEDKENQAIEKHSNIPNGEAKVPGVQKTVRIDESVLSENAQKQEEQEKTKTEVIPPDLERYIRRYLGLPVMLKAGEYSPNNPLVRAERGTGDVLLGIGEYERRRNTLRKIQQQQYREYLDQQAKLKQEERQKAERERREREEKERQREEELERARKEIEQQNVEAEQRRCRLIDQQNVATGQARCRQQKEKHAEEQRRYNLDNAEEERRSSVCYVPTVSSQANVTGSWRNKVDTGVQVGSSKPLSVAVQTDDAELYQLSISPSKSQLTQAERELSPRTVEDLDNRPIHPASWTTQGWGEGTRDQDKAARRRSYGDFDERPQCVSTTVKRSSRDRLISDLRHTYMPSIFDADAIHMRNLQAEKEAAERRQFYQQELKNQILEQQRIREERKNREKMLEAAEMRRLEGQLRMLRAAQSSETHKHEGIAAKMKESSSEFEKKRTTLQKEIDLEQQKLFRAKTRPQPKPTTSHSDTNTKLPTFYNTEKRMPFSTNISENSIFNPNYDVDTYLRKNLNPKKDFTSKFDSESDRKIVVEKALIHDYPKEKLKLDLKPKYDSNLLKNLDEIKDDTPIPVLRHSPKTINNVEDSNDTSERMKLVEDKWSVPVVQKNILKNVPKEDGKNISILTQLGSIRRQLQLEQLRLDKMTSKRK